MSRLLKMSLSIQVLLFRGLLELSREPPLVLAPRFIAPLSDLVPVWWSRGYLNLKLGQGPRLVRFLTFALAPIWRQIQKSVPMSRSKILRSARVPKFLISPTSVMPPSVKAQISEPPPYLLTTTGLKSTAPPSEMTFEWAVTPCWSHL